jgi:hypothetical protein
MVNEVSAEELLAGTGPAVMQHIRANVMNFLATAEQDMLALCSKSLHRAHMRESRSLSHTILVNATEEELEQPHSNAVKDPFGEWTASADIQRFLTSVSITRFAVAYLKLPTDGRLSALLVANGMLAQAKEVVHSLGCNFPIGYGGPDDNNQLLGSAIAIAAARKRIDILDWFYHYIAADDHLAQRVGLIAGFTGCRTPSAARTLLSYWQPIRSHHISWQRKASMAAIAASSHNVEALKWLRESGDLFLSDQAAQAAARVNAVQVLKWLWKQDCPMGPLVPANAAYGDCYEALRFLLDVGIKIDARLLSLAQESSDPRIRQEFGYE